MEFMNLYKRLSEIAAKMPEKVAICYGGLEICYRELERNSNQLANFLYQKVKEPKNIPIFMDRCPELVESVFGIMKAGCLFAPLDPYIPENRLKLMLDEIEAEWIICRSEWLPKLNTIASQRNQKMKTLVPDRDYTDPVPYPNLDIFQPEFHSLPLECDFSLPEPNPHCYIYFTTGSTGKPKGILGRHLSLSQFITWEIKEIGINDTFRTGQLIAPSFGPYKRDIFCAVMLRGHPLYPGKPGDHSRRRKTGNVA